MRVKIAYSVEEEEVLREAGKILNLSADKMQEAIELFGDVQKALASDEEGGVNVGRALGMLEEFRRALFEVDTRVAEVTSIVEAYDDYRHQRRAETAEVVQPQEAPPA